jgi:hypothetical protein
LLTDYDFLLFSLFFCELDVPYKVFMFGIPVYEKPWTSELRFTLVGINDDPVTALGNSFNIYSKNGLSGPL